MKPVTKLIAAILLSAAILVWATSKTDAAFRPAPSPDYDTTYLPSDAYTGCTISSQQFDSFFNDTQAQSGGLVLPANSVAFSPDNNCAFYRWAEQMFLWVTSPMPKPDGVTGIVLESGVFYDVSSADSSGTRTLKPHSYSSPLQMSSFLKKDGPHRLPVIRDSKGQLYEVEGRVEAEKRQVVVKDGRGSMAFVKQVLRDKSGKYTLLDNKGKVIPNPKAQLKHSGGSIRTAQIIGKVGGRNVYLTVDNSYIDSEEGQATGSVLMAQTGSLVYYLTMVNDVYAWYMTGCKNGKISDTTFPTDSNALNRICGIARDNGQVLPDSNALAMEFKSSWVEADSLPAAVRNNYITVSASIPVYKKYPFASKFGDSIWVPTDSNRMATMALIGIHVVGSAAGHPEMIWATFEHTSNAPNASYTYINQQGNTNTVKPKDGGNWLLSANLNNSGYNKEHMRTNNILYKQDFNFTTNSSGDTIYADYDSGFTISSSNTNRAMPWGSTTGAATNQQDKSSAASNSEIISFNYNIRKLFTGNDIRKNYLLIGATWTQGGAPPNTISYGVDTSHGVAIGTSLLANSTMETYFQSNSTSCFSCHSASNPDNPSLSPDSLSHVFTTTGPLLGYTAWLQRFRQNSPPPR